MDDNGLPHEYYFEVNEVKVSPCCCCGGNVLATDFEGLNLYMDIEKLSAEFTRVLRQVDKFDQHVNYLTDVEAESDCNSADIIFNLIKGNKERSESVKTLKLEVENYTK